MNYAQAFLMANMNAFPPETLPIIKEELNRLDEKSVSMLWMTDIKNPMTALLFSIFLGELGVDRFYIGHKELGIAKLALTIIGYVTLFIVIGFFILLGVYIWKLVDCFLIMRACKQANFERFMWQVNQAKMFQQARSTSAKNGASVVVEAAEEVPVANEEDMSATSEVVAVEEPTLVREEDMSE
ncbi:TM2 domain-containing protein [Streptococcus cuniculi]|uniref:TM2 domain-containing protein n=1 Tax=Streptococcus cuniculi TaxID=1432788 RepID=A0A4Y9JDR9_9STRE|nr:TM2 domain-containing protein [Streptococcus cuniculi]MBF0777388.1 TM2 domain-containing protein [Streptococcus cuniculi]TFU98987.1 TM2 domain-containing protein [Streptococcus cuniculi]